MFFNLSRVLSKALIQMTVCFCLHGVFYCAALCCAYFMTYFFSLSLQWSLE